MMFTERTNDGKWRLLNHNGRLLNEEAATYDSLIEAEVDAGEVSSALGKSRYILLIIAVVGLPMS